MFRQWSPQKSDPEIERLDKETQKIRQQLHDLREFGRQKRLNRLQAMDAFETKRVTLTEILRRMEKELEDQDVYMYGDVLAEVFGERKIFAHRAIGLESLLCQFMHQMLAKQHQLKIIKKSSKEIQSKYKKFKLKNKDEFHSFEALAVQGEASRLTLEAMYDDIFAAQHRMFAILNNQGEAGEGTITNYSMPVNNNKNRKKLEKKPSLVVSTKHPVLKEDYEGAQTPDTDPGMESDDYETAMDILAVSQRSATSDGNGNIIQHSHSDEKKEMAELEVRKSSSRRRSSTRSRSPKNEGGPTHDTSPKSKSRSSRSGSRRSSESSAKSARERRREIEQLRQARVVGGASRGSNMSAFDPIEDDEDAISPTSARDRMRELEVKRQTLSPLTVEEVDENSKSDEKGRSISPKPKSKDGEDETEEERKIRERRERRNERRASRKSGKEDIGFE